MEKKLLEARHAESIGIEYGKNVLCFNGMSVVYVR